jgi:hypothetical protein
MVAETTDRRRANLTATLGFLQLHPRAPELRLLHRWLDTWRGVGVLAAGLHRVGYDLSLIQHADEGWNATFFVTGRMHSIAGGWANAPTPWRAVQRAGWDAIQHAKRFF